MNTALTTPTICSIDDCERPHEARGWCNAHYRRWRKTGDPGALAVIRMAVVGATEAERFWLYVDKSPLTGCWHWTGGKDRGGYGDFRNTVGAHVRAHRYAYESLVGPIPDGLQIDHLCRVRHCVNPSHLEPVTARVNTLRSKAPSARNAAKTECKRGHPFDHLNTAFQSDGRRSCRACNLEHGRNHRKRLKTGNLEGKLQ